MSQPHLLLTPVTTRAIRALVGRGHTHPISHDTLYLHKVRFEDYKLSVPHGYTIHYDTGYYRPKWLCRHLSIKGPAKWPGMEEVRRLMQLAAFKSSLEEAASWHDGQARRTIHLLEPLDGDWSPWRSS
jgi:hypothetical protein